MIRWLAAAGLSIAVTVAITFPLLRLFGSALPHDAGDPVLNTWILWWGTRAVPFTAAWWNAPMFFPMSGSLALSELLVGLLPLTAPVQWLTGNPVAAYNTAFFLSFPLCAAAAAALAWEITRRRDVSMIAGIAFALAPYRMGQLSHLQMLSYYWAPLALLALHRFVRTRRWLWLAVFGAAWLLQALANGYAMFQLSVLLILWIGWFVRPFRSGAPIVIAWACAAVPMLPSLLMYRRVHEQLHLVRDINEVKRFSVDVAGFLVAPRDLLLWGTPRADAYQETALFPGATILIVAAIAVFAVARLRGHHDQRWNLAARISAGVALLAGAVAFSTIVVGPWSVGRVLQVSEFHKPFSIAVLAALVAVAQRPFFPRMWRDRSVLGFYTLAAIAMYVLALGPSPTFFGHPMLYEPPYAWLMRLPGFDVLRVPARFAMLAVLCQSVAVAMILARVGHGRRRLAVIAAVAVGLLADGWIRLPVAVVASTPPPAWSGVSAVVELPPGQSDVDFPALDRSMTHGQPIVNGYSGYAPPHYLPLAHAISDRQFEALREVAAYGRIGVAIDRSQSGAAAMAAGVQTLAGVEPGPQSDRWITFVLPVQSRRTDPVGAPIPLQSVHANVHDEDVKRLVDATVETAWGSGADQRGGEAIVADLGSPQDIGAVTLQMGAYAFGHPRDLRVEVSLDALSWSDAWHGPTAVATVRAALADPGLVPVTIPIQPVSARFVRLTQTGRQPGIPWWVAELQVCAAAR